MDMTLSDICLNPSNEELEIQLYQVFRTPINFRTLRYEKMMMNIPTLGNTTFDDIKSIEPPVVKLAKINLPQISTKGVLAATFVDNSVQVRYKHLFKQSSISQEASTAIGRKDSIDNSSCTQCSEFLCVGDCASIDILNDAVSNFSVASSSFAEQSEVDDDFSEHWDMSSICTDNGSCYRKVRFLQIKPMDEQCEEASAITISDVLPVFEQIEKSSRIGHRGGLQQLLEKQSEQPRILQGSQIMVQDMLVEEAKNLDSWGGSCCGDRKFNRGSSQNIFALVGAKSIKARKQQGKQHHQFEENKSTSSLSGPSERYYTTTPNTTTTPYPITKIEEEVERNEELKQGNLPVGDHDDCPIKPPMKRQEAVICLSFELMNRKVAESARVRASKYLAGVPAPSRDGMMSMVAEVYRLLLLPEEALQLYTQCLSSQQLLEEFDSIMKRLCCKVNRHPKLQEALAKIAKFYKN